MNNNIQYYVVRISNDRIHKLISHLTNLLQ